MDEPAMTRQIARRAALWTVIGLVGFISVAFLIRGVAVGLGDEASQVAAIACILCAIAGATMYVSRRVGDIGSSYQAGYRDGFADGRQVGAVVPFTQERDRVR